MTIDRTEISYLDLMMEIDQLESKRVIVFHISSLGQLQFIAPIWREIIQQKLPWSLYLACDYDVKGRIAGLEIPATRCMTSEIARELERTELFLETEIYGRGPKSAMKIFIGHGQPNKWTNWSDENLLAFDHYFLYGELERSMFNVIKSKQPKSTRHIRLHNIGYPKLDDQMNGRYDGKQILECLGLEPSRKTIIYAPAWDPGGALRSYGPIVPQILLDAGDFNVIVKLHPASLELPDAPTYQFYTGGFDWAAVFSVLEANPRFRYVNEHLINPLLFAADLMVTDFSGVALEFMTLDRPVIYLHCPDFYEKTLIEWGNDPMVSLYDERFNAGRDAGLVVMKPEQLGDAVLRSLALPEECAVKRQQLMKKFIYNPGRGSVATVEAMAGLLNEK